MTDLREDRARWAADFNHADPAYNADAHAIWDELRDGGCPVAHSDRYGGMWAPLTHELVHEIAYSGQLPIARRALSSSSGGTVPSPRTTAFP